MLPAGTTLQQQPPLALYDSSIAGSPNRILDQRYHESDSTSSLGEIGGCFSDDEQGSYADGSHTSLHPSVGDLYRSSHVADDRHQSQQDGIEQSVMRQSGTSDSFWSSQHSLAQFSTTGPYLNEHPSSQRLEISNGGRADEYGIDQSLMDPDLEEKRDHFSADVDETRPGRNDVEDGPSAQRDQQSLGVICQAGALSDQSLSSPATLTFSRHGTGPIQRQPRRPARRPPRRRRAQSGQAPSSPGSSTASCSICDADPDCRDKPVFTGDWRENSLRRHMRTTHSGQPRAVYHCSLSPCQSVIGPAQNRRRHIMDFHPLEDAHLPPVDPTRRSRNHEVDEKLYTWFRKEYE